MTSALEDGRLSAIRTGRLYPQEYPGTHLKSLSRPRAHGICWMPRKKSPVTPPGIDPGTFRLVSQCLNHYATPGPYETISEVFNPEVWSSDFVRNIGNSLLLNTELHPRRLHSSLISLWGPQMSHIDDTVFRSHRLLSRHDNLGNILIAQKIRCLGCCSSSVLCWLLCYVYVA
jgi:hypothetical protein